MKVAVLGAGAVGSYFGARLHLAGHEVVLIGRRGTVEAVNASGLRLVARDFDGVLLMRASVEPAAVEGADLVLFCVKSGDTESAGAAMKPFLPPGCTVLSMQNGVDNAARLSRLLELDVVPAAVYVAVAMDGPAHVTHHGRGELAIGPAAGSERVARAFIAAGVPVTVTPAVLAALWAKLAANCAYNALSALTQLPYGEMVRRPGMEQTMRGAVAECRAVAAAEGIELPPTLWDDVFDLSRGMAGQRSSTAQDLARGRRSEIDYINGHVVKLGDRHGIPVPVNRLLHGLVRIRDDG